MKYFKLLFLSTLFISFLSCSDDDEDTPPIDIDSLIGTWTAVSIEADIDLDGNFAGFPIESSTKSIGENLDYDLTFTETTYTAAGSYDLVTTGTLAGEPFEDTESLTDISETGTYSLDGNTITVDGSLYDFDVEEVDLSEILDEQTAEISFNSDGELVVKQNIDQTVNEEGITFTIKIDATTVWKRK